MNQPSLDQLADLVIQWGANRGILDHATPHNQFTKTLEEVEELNVALAAGDDAEIMDGIGDVTVTLILLAKLKGWTLAECLNHAYRIIAKRTGRMSGGMFIKDVPSDDDLGELDASKACRVEDPECTSCQ